MKPFLTILFIFLSYLFISAQETGGSGDSDYSIVGVSYHFEVTDNISALLSHLPFTDDFTDKYKNWTTVSIAGGDVWHISGDDGIDGGRCARFYKISDPGQQNDDWLVSPVFNTEGISNLAITFKYLYNVDGASPEFYYASSFDGNPVNSEWKQIDKSFWVNEWGWQDARIEIENPGESFVFAVRYNVTADDPYYYFLMDNFKVESYIPPAPFELVGTSDHFEFYTNIPDQQNYYVAIQQALEAYYLNSTSLWNRPLLDDIYKDVDKVKVYFSEKEEIPFVSGDIPDWKCGTLNIKENSIYICQLKTIDQLSYYHNLNELAVNTFSQYALVKFLKRKQINNNPQYFLEGFGLMESGNKANRDSVIQCLTKLETEAPTLNALADISNIASSCHKDLLLTYIESLVLVNCYFYIEPGYGEYGWEKYLKYYYLANETDRINLLKSTDHFNIYAANYQSDVVDKFAQDMEVEYQKNKERYDFDFHHKINITIYQSEVGKEINNSSSYMGQAFGGDHFSLSPITGKSTLGHHEYMHNLVNMFCGIGPGQFLNEGLAQFAAHGLMTEAEIPSHRYKIQDMFYHFQFKYNREPTIEEIFTNSENFVADSFWIDVYYLGQLFWTYIYNKYGDYVKFKDFLSAGNDFSVFDGKTKEVEVEEFLQYWRELAYFGPPKELKALPFQENFSNDFKGWTLLHYKAQDNWQITNNEGGNGNCARIVKSGTEEKDVDSWLISPPIITGGSNQIDFKFSYKKEGTGLVPEIYYAGNFTGIFNITNWIKIENFSWDAPEATWTECGFITINNPPEKINLAIRYQSEDNNNLRLSVDNFIVDVTSDHKPVVSTGDVTYFRTVSAILNATVSSDEGSAVTRRGFYWSSTNTSPGATDHVVTVAGTNGSYSYNLTGLSPSTNYYYRAYATNSEGTGLGEVKQFTTLENLITIPLPFTDDFEDEDDDVFYKWTTENLEGWQYWHVIGWGGNGGSHCMRFEICDINQNDWLITKAIDCSSPEKLAINFDILYSGNGQQPKLFYTSSYNGNYAQSNWTELNYSLGANQNEWHSVDEMVIDSPGDVVYFAYQYLSNQQNVIYCLLDNFSVKEFIELPEYVLAGSSAHFDFYTNMPDKASFYLDIQNGLESEFTKLNSHWNRPGQEKVFEDNARVNVYYSLKENQPGLEGYLDSWRCGFYLSDGNTIYLTPLITNDEVSYYNDLEGEAVHTFSKMALRKRLTRDAGHLTSLPNYFGEGFGLYQIGYRPNRDSIISYLNNHPGSLDQNSISDISDITSTSKKDMIVSYVEGQILLPLGYRYCAPDYGSFPAIWNNYLTYFYNTSDEVQIKKQASSENFDIYCSSRDIEYADSMLVWLERTLQFYKTSYQMEINNRFNMVVLYDEKTGMDLTGYDNFNGGAGGLNISPHNFYDGIEGYPWLLAHEFGHVFNDYMYYDFPVGFYHEGMANFSGYMQYGVDWMESKWLINYVFDYYQQNYQRKPTLDEFINNPDNEIDPYFFGLQFIRYLNTFNSLIDIRRFFNEGLDFNVFSLSKTEIEQGYINYLLNMTSSITTESINNSMIKLISEGDNMVVVSYDNSLIIEMVELFSVTGQKEFSSRMTNNQHISIPLISKNSIKLLRIITNKGVITRKLYN